MSYDPFKDPVPRTKPRASGKLWELFKGHDIYACELKYHGEFGLEAQNFEAGWLLVGRRFDTRALAANWAMLEKEDFEKGGD